MSVVEFPKDVGPEQPPLLVGPFEKYKVQVEGRIIPRLTGWPCENGNIRLIVDGRFMAEFTPDAARDAAWLIAQALAIGEGYGTRQIAEKLNISIKTAETHREHIREKLNLDTTFELVQQAIHWRHYEART